MNHHNSEYIGIADYLELGNDRLVRHLNKIEDELKKINDTIETELERNNILLERIIKILENNMTSKE